MTALMRAVKISARTATIIGAITGTITAATTAAMKAKMIVAITNRDQAELSTKELWLV